MSVAVRVVEFAVAYAALVFVALALCGANGPDEDES